MSDPFVAEIRLFPIDFAPKGWAACDGQLMAISQNTALFSLLGTIYGGDGKATFALPDLRAAVPGHPGQGAGLSERYLGELTGTPAVSLLSSEMPQHTHSLQAKNSNAVAADPTGNALARGNYSSGTQTGAVAFYQTAAANVQMNLAALAMQGNNQPHNNMMPYLVLNYFIALQGVYPQRP